MEEKPKPTTEGKTKPLTVENDNTYDRGKAKTICDKGNNNYSDRRNKTFSEKTR
ncbi:hypothetical protein IHO40_02690 [Wolbachia endosymbiont of Mansonella ozzardi]|uniref:hypothetical protein n=1 Tax=Wolbachia endosymbiont of Mansonella ozzardi TaxID=137464 RepID=UPI001CE1E4C0|nr:hypothetical protein [Wolbachia endosymbiont of Mansonella ozzardi]MCA4775020.1 hypothetical protein [Wolbachia endosymbiont of Mansonella ozzardi]